MGGVMRECSRKPLRPRRILARTRGLRGGIAVPFQCPIDIHYGREI